MTVLLVGGVAWIGAHELDPRKPIIAAADPIRIQVVSLNWKWLFIYPDQSVASINELTVPAGAPIEFELTSSGVMNSFFVPQLGSPIYTMSGMTTHLQLLANSAGNYPGLSANFSGEGFADMRFTVHAVSSEQFQKWVVSTHDSGPALDAATYADLVRPTSAVAPTTYRSVAPGLFDYILTSGLSPDGRTCNAYASIRRTVQ